MLRTQTLALIARRLCRIQIERSLSTTSVTPIKFQPATNKFNVSPNITTPSQRWYCSASEEVEEPKKKKKQKKNPPAVEHVGRLDMRVGKIIEVSKAPDAESLYLTRVDVGDEVRSIVAGIANVIPADQLLGRNVIILYNLKTAKLRGHTSEGMIMCAKSGDKTEPLDPPKNATPGDLVYCESYERVPVETPRDKKKLFDSLAADLKTNDNLIACYKDAALYIPDKGNITAESMKNADIR